MLFELWRKQLTWGPETRPRPKRIDLDKDGVVSCWRRGDRDTSPSPARASPTQELQFHLKICKTGPKLDMCLSEGIDSCYNFRLQWCMNFNLHPARGKGNLVKLIRKWFLSADKRHGFFFCKYFRDPVLSSGGLYLYSHVYGIPNDFGMDSIIPGTEHN